MTPRQRSGVGDLFDGDSGLEVLERIASALEAIAARGSFVAPKHDYLLGQSARVEPGDEGTMRFYPQGESRLEAIHIFSPERRLARATVLIPHFKSNPLVSDAALPENGLGLRLALVVQPSMTIAVRVTNDYGAPQTLFANAYFRRAMPDSPYPFG